MTSCDPYNFPDVTVFVLNHTVSNLDDSLLVEDLVELLLSGVLNTDDKSSIAGTIANFYSMHNEFNKSNEYLLKVNSTEALQQYVMQSIEMGNYLNASDVINILSRKSDQGDFVNIASKYLALKKVGFGWRDLTPNQRVDIESIGLSNSKQKEWAQSILTRIDNATIKLFPEQLANERQELKPLFNLEKLLSFAPNPCKDKTLMQWQRMPELTNAFVFIYNTQGNLVTTIPINSKVGSYELDVSNLSSGLYLATFVNDNSTLGSIKIVKQ